jgi:hypothetical protein
MLWQSGQQAVTEWCNMLQTTLSPRYLMQQTYCRAALLSSKISSNALTAAAAAAAANAGSAFW